MPKRHKARFLFPFSTVHFPLFFTLLLSACAHPAPRADVEPPSPPRAPADHREGLDAIWWMTDDKENQVGQTLAPFLDPPQPIDHALRERWRTTGLRLVRVPIAQLPVVQAALPPAAQRYRQPIGWTTEWLELFRGRRVGGAPLSIAGTPRTLPPGVMRLITRCWPAPPSASAAAAVHLDLAFQFERASDAKPADPFAAPTILKEEDRGEILRPLTLAASIEPGFAYILTCEAPDTTWKPRPLSNKEDTGFSPPDADDPQPAAPRKPPSPILPSLTTLAEASMQTDSTDANPRRYRAVIALIVRAKGDFRLLP